MTNEAYEPRRNGGHSRHGEIELHPRLARTKNKERVHPRGSEATYRTPKRLTWTTYP